MKLAAAVSCLFLSLAACAVQSGALPPKSGAQPGDAGDVAKDSSKPLPTDPAVRTGTLDNGLTYYIRQHKKPEKRVLLWLAVDAGSVLEDDDQRGLAHFVEHMAFNGTRRFEKNTIIDFLEKSGMKFGADVNAFTSFDETVYQLQVPSDKPKLLSTGLDVLEDWAGAVSFDEVEVDKERGVVVEEWRRRRGAFQRTFDKQMPLLFQDSKYAERLPIGKKKILENAPTATLKRFYNDWYRPDLMAVIVVGDIDPAKMEQDVKSRFGRLKGPDKPRKRDNVNVPMIDETRAGVFPDKEMSMTNVSVSIKGPLSEFKTENDYRKKLVEDLFHGMLRARLDELSRSPDAPHTFAFSSSGRQGRTVDVFSLRAGAKTGKAAKALELLLTEVERVRQHGFVATELEREKAKLLRRRETSVAEKDTVNGRRYAFRLMRAFLEDRATPGPDAHLALTKRFLPEVTIKEVNAVAEAWTKRKDRVVTASGPARDEMPSDKQMLAVVDSVSKLKPAAYEDTTSEGGALIAKLPKPGTITKETEIKEIGVTVWELSNGARVVVRPTDFKNDEVLFRAFSPGGTSLVKTKHYHSANSADGIVGQSGVGQHDAIALKKMLAGKVVRVSPSIGETEEGVRGSASPKDLETAMQLLHLQFGAPRSDPRAFEAWKSRMVEFVKNRDLSPQATFFEKVTEVTYNNHPRRRPLTAEALDKVDHAKALEFYEQRFANAGDFTFVFVGNVDKSRLKDLSAKYLASLPGKKSREKWRDIKANPAKGIKKVRVAKGQDHKSYVWLAFHGDRKWSAERADDLKMLSTYMGMRLREVLREDMSGVYGASSRGSFNRRPKERYTYYVGFGCAPENVDKLKAAVFEIITKTKKAGVDEEYVSKIREQRRRALMKNKKENRFWLRQLAKHYRYGTDPKEILELDKQVQRVSAKQIQSAAKKFLNTNRYVYGVLVPEADADPPTERKEGGKSLKGGKKAPAAAAPAPAAKSK